MDKKINVNVTFTPGYEQRFTAACLEVIKRRDRNSENKKSNNVNGSIVFEHRINALERA